MWYGKGDTQYRIADGRAICFKLADSPPLLPDAPPPPIIRGTADIRHRQVHAHISRFGAAECDAGTLTCMRAALDMPCQTGDNPPPFISELMFARLRVPAGLKTVLHARDSDAKVLFVPRVTRRRNMMVYRIEIGLKTGVPDARGRRVAERVAELPGIDVRACRTRDVYKVAARIDAEAAERVKQAFSDPVVAEAALDRLPMGEAFDWCLEIGFRPGVTDIAGRTARGALQDVIGRQLAQDEQVHTTTQYFLSGALTRVDTERIGSDLLANGLIQTVAVCSQEEWEVAEPDRRIPVLGATARKVDEIALPEDDEGLMQISSERMLSLSADEMRAIRAHFRQEDVQARRRVLELPPWPTDVEIECIAQTWSEHCAHKIFAGTVHYRDEEEGTEKTIHSLYRSLVQASTRKIAESVNWLVSVFTDNAGVVRFDERQNLVCKVETHNSPSALDPYGGAMTGIVGVNRDPLGTGMGAALLSNMWGYCLAPPFCDRSLPEGLMHPRRIRDGVHRGVADGGNQSGIPYSRGFEWFDERYLAQPLVYCGTLGTMPKEVAGRPSERKEVVPGDWAVMCGGRIGRDGIRGATFSSEELRPELPTQAVQIGDPLTQRKLYEFLLEARNLNLFRGITDNGAGGLSCSFGEMGRHSGGCECDLAGAPLKYEGLQPWEVLVSEAQERMTLAIPREQRAAFEALAHRRDVEVAFMGTFNDSGFFTVRQDGQIVASLDMEFLYGDARPQMVMPAVWKKPTVPAPSPEAPTGFSDTLVRLMGDLNLCSREFRSRFYDGEVKGLSVVKPFVGVHADVPSDATVMRVDYSSSRGAVLAEGINPWHSDLDTYSMAASAVDEAVRRVIAVGGDLEQIALLDNFCWPDPVASEKNPDGAYKMAQLVRACQALYDLTTLYRTALISGKDSCKNDATCGGRRLSIPPTLLISAVGQMEDVRKAVTLPLKMAGDLIYVVGETRCELGASAYHRLLAAKQGTPGSYGGQVPEVHGVQALEIYAAMNRATGSGLLRSSTTPAKGGLAVALARAAIGGQLGASINPAVPGDPDAASLLFSESNSRFALSVAPADTTALESLFEGLPISRIGTVTAEKRLVVNGLVDVGIDVLSAEFKRTLHDV